MKKIQQRSVLLLVGLFAVMYLLLFGYPTQATGSMMAIGYTLDFEDGTSRTLNPMETLSVLNWNALKLIDPATNKAIKSITISTSVAVDWEGDMTGFTVTGSQVSSVGAVARQTTPLQKPATLVKGVAFTAATATIQANTLTGWSAVGSNTLSTTSTVSVTLDFLDDPSDTQSGENTGTYVYNNVSSKIKSLTINVGTSPLV